MYQVGIPWQAYIAEDMMFLFKDLSKGEHQARTDLVADFIKGDEEHFLQQLDRQDKQLIGIPTTSADNPQSRSKEFDDGPAKPGSKKRLTEIRGNEIAIKDEDTLMWEAEGPDESAVDNTSTPKTTEKSELVDNPKSAVAALDGKAVKTDPKFSDSKPAESTPAPSLLQSQNGHPKPEVGLLEFSMEVNDDGRTFLGQVVHVIKIGESDSRVVVNEGTERLPSFAVYPGAVRCLRKCAGKSCGRASSKTARNDAMSSLALQCLVLRVFNQCIIVFKTNFVTQIEKNLCGCLLFPKSLSLRAVFPCGGSSLQQ